MGGRVGVGGGGGGGTGRQGTLDLVDRFEGYCDVQD